MKNIWIILKKELRRYFTDTRMLIGIILPGILIFLLYSVMGNFMNGNSTSDITEFKIYAEQQPEAITSILPSYFKMFYFEQTLTK